MRSVKSTKTETVRPEHVILSDEIQANGDRDLTLRVMTKDKSSFRFLQVVGGADAYPELTPSGSWEVTGEVTPDGNYERIDVHSFRKLSATEESKQRKESSDYWEVLDARS